MDHLQSLSGALAVAGALVVLVVAGIIFANLRGDDKSSTSTGYPWLRLDEVLAVVRDPNWSWTRNHRCKYLSFRVDTRTRTNLCLIYDRYGHALTLDELRSQEGRGR